MTLGSSVHRLRLGTFVRPGSETPDGRARAEVVLAYLVRHPDGLLLLDTGIGTVDAETEAHYRPVRRDLRMALAEQGAELADVDLVVNCHLHFDHCGGNRLLAGRPVLAQRRELELAHEEGYTVPELVDYPQVRYEVLDGEAEVWPGVLVLPTPGHTAGHQSLAVRLPDGTVVLAGQAHDHASDLTADVLAAELRGTQPTAEPTAERTSEPTSGPMHEPTSGPM
ncbi:MAG TPA: MBL fold metallo-hydrolase, partial [Actinomycetales bacterium]|nr:MBL fold metallo-hydrolase [Actinomycetales bacterium]